MEINDKIMDSMRKADKPLKASEIATLSGVDKKDVDKAIKNLQKEGLIHSPVRCCYSIKSK